MRSTSALAAFTAAATDVCVVGSNVGVDFEKGSTPLVHGYPGSPQMLLAMEKGEVEGFCGIGWTYLKLRKADWVAQKKFNILFQMPLERHPDIADVPRIREFAQIADILRFQRCARSGREIAGYASRTIAFAERIQVVR